MSSNVRDPTYRNMLLRSILLPTTGSVTMRGSTKSVFLHQFNCAEYHTSDVCHHLSFQGPSIITNHPLRKSPSTGFRTTGKQFCQGYTNNVNILKQLKQFCFRVQSTTLNYHNFARMIHNNTTTDNIKVQYLLVYSCILIVLAAIGDGVMVIY